MVYEQVKSSADLSFFTMRELTTCGAALRSLGSPDFSIEETAAGATEHLYNRFRNPSTGQRSIALARFFLTLPYHRLEADLKEIVRRRLDLQEPHPSLPCMTLMASAGRKSEWNSRFRSEQHRVFPLMNGSYLANQPMLGQLVRLFEFPLDGLDREEQQGESSAVENLKVFHVPKAQGSPYIPHQADFIVPYGIRSVLGFGSHLPNGHQFTVLLFSRDPIPSSTADLFKPLALSLKVALLKSSSDAVFGSAHA